MAKKAKTKVKAKAETKPKRKSIPVTAYKVGTVETTTTAINIKKEVISALNKQDTIEKRFMQLNENDEMEEGDFISSYESKKKWLFGSFLRIKEGEMAQILK